MEKGRQEWKRWLWAFLFGAALITVYKTFDNLSRVFAALGSFLSLLTPFTIGLLLAFFLYPATVRLETKLAKSKRKFIIVRSKTIAILTVYFTFIALLLLAIGFVLPWLSASMAELLKKLPDYITQLGDFINSLTREGGMLAHFHLDSVVQSINVQKILQNILMQDVWGYVKGVKGVTGALSNGIIGVVVCAYALLERESLFKLMRKVFGLFMKEKSLSVAGEYVHRISTIFYRFFFGKMIDSLIIGIIAIIGFSLLKVPFAVLLGLVVMVFNMIPYFGPIIGAIPAIIITLLVKDIYLALWTALFILALQQFDGIWLGPKILGGSVGVSPFWVIFAIVVFGGLFGLWGMVFGVPIVATIQMLGEDYLDDKKLNLTTVKASKNE